MGQQSYQSGHDAEKVAALYLESKNYLIRELNWRTPVCEIDIIAAKKEIVYFIEVKYRSKDGQGGGLEYITPKKLQQMQFAAECWVQAQQHEGDYELGVIELSSNFQITNCIIGLD